MRKYTLGMCAVLLAFMLGPPGKLRAGTLGLTFVGASNYLGSYYVAPYQVSIGGTTYNLVCDDALDNVSVGQQWNATTETLSNLNGTLFSQGHLDNNSSKTISQSQAYAEAGWLVSQIIANGNSTAAGEYQYALWDLFDPGFSNTSGTLSNGEPGADLNSAEQSAVNADLTTAESSYTNCPKCSTMVIYTPSPQGKNEPQEFFGMGTPQAMPEPMTLWSLLVVLVAVALAYKWVDKTTVESSASAST
ncbi:MAG TPA: hypothetical protein VI455_03330 [Terriglobia bacterium]